MVHRTHTKVLKPGLETSWYRSKPSKLKKPLLVCNLHLHSHALGKPRFCMTTETVLVGGIMKNHRKIVDPNYGISRFDDELHSTHGWRVSLRRYGKMLVENFPDKKHGGRHKALKLAQQYRDELLGKFPPISRKEVCLIKRSNNKSGISGV